jgi:hypothetical protein
MNALNLSGVLAIPGNRQLNIVVVMIELRFEIPMGYNLCSGSGSNSLVRLKQTFVQQQGAAT